ncbi:MAG: alpha/beta fold hydrolase [Calditrichaeota bacterium]|nr:MAG: alpha/beta fold hydrolase [Calditrichota bacterium]
MHSSNSNIIHVNDVDLYYEIHGQGSPLVLIGGLGVGVWFWEYQLPAFSSYFRTIIFDNRGVGKSSKPPGPYSIEQMTVDLVALLDHLNIPKTHVLGFSLGGYIALELAISSPERVDRLILAGTSAGGKNATPMAPEVLQLLLKTEGNPEELIREKLTLAFTEEYLRKTDLSKFIRQRLEDPQPRHAFLAQAQAGANFDRSQDLYRVVAPTLILAASGDPIIPLPNAQFMAANIPNSVLKIYQGFAHQFLIENAEEFNRDVITFLQNSSVRR